jgi:hypothetical protein
MDLINPNQIFSNGSIDLYLSHEYGMLMNKTGYIQNLINTEPISKLFTWAGHVQVTKKSDALIYFILVLDWVCGGFY